MGASESYTAMVELGEAVLALETVDEVTALLGVLFTRKELEEINDRWMACQMVLNGTPQRRICATLKVGNSKAARCAKAVREANEEFGTFMSRLGLSDQISSDIPGGPK